MAYQLNRVAIIIMYLNSILVPFSFLDAKQLKWEEKRMKHDNIDWRRKKVQATKRKLKKPSRGKNIKIKQNMNKHSKKQTNYQKKRHSKH